MFTLTDEEYFSRSNNSNPGIFIGEEMLGYVKLVKAWYSRTYMSLS